VVSLAVSTVRGLRPRTTKWANRLEQASPVRVLGALVVLQWVLVLGLAMTIRHAGWIYYQGGDQLWYYTSSWLLVHGHFTQPGIGYLWPILLAPIALVAGADLVQAFPAVIVVQVVFLLPVALLALYGIARRIGGRLFGYWAAVVWLVVPLIGIWYTEPGYHQRFTEVFLPQGFGLTGTADFPTMVATLVAAYFCARAICDGERSPTIAVAAGMATGAAIALKPSTALFLVGPALAFIVVRSWRSGAAYAGGLAPALVALAFVKWRGFGYLPLLHSAAGARTAAAAALMPLGGLGMHIPWSWHVFVTQLDQLREHFWSARLVEWLAIAGSIAIVIRSRRLGALIVGWFAAIVIVKTGSGRGDLQSGSLLRLLMPAYPAFVLLLASLPFLVPGLARRVRSDQPAGRRVLSSRQTTIALVAAVLLTAVVPVAAYAVAHPLRGNPLGAAILQTPPIPVEQDLGLTAGKTAAGVSLSWDAQHPAGGPVFYHVFRRDPKTELAGCSATGGGAARCQLELTDLGTTHSASFVDRTAGAQRFDYYVGVAANWLNDPAYGDVYELSRGASAGP
jgi:hypothetical protein